MRQGSPMQNITVLSGGHGRGPLPPGTPPRLASGACPGGPRRRGHGGRQHRRRPLGARAQGLSRPRHRDVHPRRRHRPRAGLGPPRRDLERQGRARGVRRGADLVRARRPRRRHPPGPHPDARRRLPALPGDRGALPALAAGRAAAADDRRPGRDPRRDRRPGVAQRPPGRALPGVLGAAARRGPGRGRGLVVGLDDATPGPGVIEAITDADLVVLPPSNPVVSVGTILGVPGVREALRRRRRRWSASPPSSAAPTCAGWPSRC